MIQCRPYNTVMIVTSAVVTEIFDVFLRMSPSVPDKINQISGRNGDDQFGEQKLSDHTGLIRMCKKDQDRFIRSG